MKKRNLIILIFLLSGMAGLVYEVVWVRLLTLIFGTSTYAVSTVLFSFMLGLALGSYLLGKKIDSVRSPLRVYAALEIGIGLYAIFVPYIISAVNSAYLSAFDENISSPLFYTLARFGFSMLVLLIPTTLMGGTLPVLSRYFVRGLGSVGWDVGILYTINTLGAVAGVLLAGFYLEATYGVQASIYIAAAVNISIGIVALLLARREQPFVSLAEPAAVSLPVTAVSGSVNLRVIAWVFAISGFCALGYEVIWFRALLLVLHNNTYVFSIMLATFLTGLTLGSYFVARMLDTNRNWVVILAWIEVAIGVVSALTFPLFIDFHNTTFLDWRYALSTSFEKITLAGFFLSGLIMLVPTLLMGAALPIVNKLCINDMSAVGRRIGVLYALNTLGAVIGSFVIGFLLIPYIGFVRSGVVLAVVNVLAGLMIMTQDRRGSVYVKRFTYGAGAALVLLALGVLVKGEWLTSNHISMSNGMTTLYYKEGPASTVTVVERGKVRAAFVNGNIVVGSTAGALQTVRLLGHLPLIMRPNSSSVAVVGFGMGVTTHSVAQHNLERIDVIEIAPEILDAAHFFRKLNQDVLKDPRLNVVLEDGRNYLLRTRKHYDVITADPVHPILGSGNLYTREYYLQCYDRLSEDGILVQYVPMHLLGDKEFRALINTFVSVFEHSSLWYSHTDLVIMGMKKPQRFDYALIEEKLRQPAVNADLALSNLGSPMKLLGRLLLGENEIKRFVAGAEINTDDHPFIEFQGPWSISRDTRPDNIENLTRYLGESTDYVDVTGLPEVRQQQVRVELDISDQAKAHILKGLVLNYRNDLTPAREEYAAALRLQPTDSGVETLLLSIEARLRRKHGVAAP